jgi:hypothetical protein
VGGVGAPPTYIMGDLASMQFEVHDVPAAPNEMTNLTRVAIHAPEGGS